MAFEGREIASNTTLTPPEVLEGIEIPGVGGRGRLYVTTRGTGGDRDPRSWGKRETIPNPTLSPPEVLEGIDIPGVGGRGRLYLTLHCHHQRYWRGSRSQEVGEEGDYT